jgi:hypothetical protein
VRKRKRLVLLHTEGPTFEGVLTGNRPRFGVYRLDQAKLREAAGQTTELDGVTEVPESRVLFVQVLSEGL